MQHRLIEQYMARPLRWLLQQNVSYWHRGLQQFRYQDSGWSLAAADAGARPGRIIIVSRAHYQEFVQHYPVTRLSELKQILQSEFQQHAQVLHFIGPEREQRRSVCSMVFSADIASQFSHHCVLVPETLLLWQAAQKSGPAASSQVVKAQAYAGYFLYCAGLTPLSQRINAFCPDYHSFMLNNGIADTVSCSELVDDNYAARLVDALRHALPRLGKLSLVNRPALQLSALPLKAMAITVSVLTLAYIGAIAGYYQLALSSQQQKIARLGSEVNQLLDTQQQLQNTDNAALTLAQLRSEKQYSAHIWQLILPLLQQNSSLALQNLATDNGRIVLRGQAEQATAVLTAIQASALVQEARFDASVRRQRDKDIFVISLILTQQPLTVPAATVPEGSHATE